MSEIELRDLTKKYNQVKAVDNVNLRVQDGEFVTILGPSGSGKTTLLTTIAGFEEPTEGSILVNGRSINGVPPHKRNIGLVFQSYALFPHMTVFQNIAFPLKVRRYSKKKINDRVKEALEIVRMTGYESRKINQLSGGQQQRVALARAIVFNPEILLLDEPMAALDRKLRQDVQVELRQLQRTLGITTIAVTHDQEEALTLSDRILILNEGRIEQFGTPEELYNRPVNRFVAEFLGNTNLFEGVVQMEDGRTFVTLRDGTKVPYPQGRFDRKTKGWVMVRPEHMTLQEPGVDAHTNSWYIKGEITSVIYLGSSVRYQIATEVGEEEVVVFDSHYPPRFEEGQRVRLTWREDASWFIRDAV